VKILSEIFRPRNDEENNLNNQTQNDKVMCQKGNSPKQVFKVPKLLLSETKDVLYKNY
jgi:hypothetical protein